MNEGFKESLADQGNKKDYAEEDQMRRNVLGLNLFC